MAKNPPKKKFQARVEIYFIIYVATIISFFAVEGEVREYKKRQENTILAISKDKIQQLVNIDRIEPFHEKETLTLNVKLDGFFDKTSLRGDVTFKPVLEEGEGKPTKPYVLEPLKKDDPHDTWFFTKIPKRDFKKESLNIEHEVTAVISVVPQFTDEVRERWVEAYQDESIVAKLEHAIKKIGRIEQIKIFPNRIVPMGFGPGAPFTMQVFRSRYPVLQGLEWEVPIIIGGVEDKSDFRISIIEGATLVSAQIINTPETRLKGRGIESGHIKVVGTRLSDDERSSVEFDLNVRPPVWTVTPSIKQVYLGETYTFDGGLRDIPSDDIEISVTGSAVEERLVSGSLVSLEPFTQEGDITFQVLVGGNEISGMTHEVKVLKPPPPSIKLSSRESNTNNLVFEIITYGRSNEVQRFQQRGGIIRNQQLSDPDIRGSKKYYKWLVEIEKPFDESAFQEISFKVWDKFKQFSEHRKQYQYNY